MKITLLESLRFLPLELLGSRNSPVYLHSFLNILLSLLPITSTTCEYNMSEIISCRKYVHLSAVVAVLVALRKTRGCSRGSRRSAK